MRKHGKKGILTLRFAAELGRRSARPGVQLAFVADRRFCRWTTDERRPAAVRH